MSIIQDRFKFRVVYYNDVEKKYFIFEPDLISADGTARAYAYGESGADEYYDAVTLNQCTGLKDKNGKLIYENDIVTDVLTNKFTINFDEKYLSFLLTNIKTKESMVFYPNIKLEIIGNIYENPLDTTKN